MRERIHMRTDLGPVRRVGIALRHQVDAPSRVRRPPGELLELAVEPKDLRVGFVHADHDRDAIDDRLEQGAVSIARPHHRGDALGHHGDDREEGLQQEERVAGGACGKRAKPVQRSRQGDAGQEEHGGRGRTTAEAKSGPYERGQTEDGQRVPGAE
jgi:hypothetical protein